jgi:superfamily II DNA or RNA helicase
VAHETLHAHGAAVGYKVRFDSAASPATAVVFLTEGVLLRELASDPELSRYDVVVVDEAHRIKNPEGIWGRSVTEISKEALSRVVLTGTPVPNGYPDIFNLYKFIYPFKFKEILKFHYHNLEDMTNNNSPESQRVQELKDNISPYFIKHFYYKIYL